MPSSVLKERDMRDHESEKQIFAAFHHAILNAIPDDLSARRAAYDTVMKIIAKIELFLDLHQKNATQGKNAGVMAFNLLMGETKTIKIINRLIIENNTDGLTIGREFFELMSRLLVINPDLQNNALAHACFLLVRKKNMNKADLHGFLTLFTKTISNQDSAKSILSALQKQQTIYERSRQQASVGNEHYTFSQFIVNAVSTAAEDDQEAIRIQHMYYKLLSRFYELKVPAKDILNLLYAPNSSNHSKPFYRPVNSIHKAMPLALKTLLTDCESLRIACLYQKLCSRPLGENEDHFLNDKEGITHYILNQPDAVKYPLIKEILEEHDRPLSQFFWTARRFTSPSIHSGQLKILHDWLMKQSLATNSVNQINTYLSDPNSTMTKTYFFKPESVTQKRTLTEDTDEEEKSRTISPTMGG